MLIWMQQIGKQALQQIYFIIVYVINILYAGAEVKIIETTLKVSLTK